MIELLNDCLHRVIAIGVPNNLIIENIFNLLNLRILINILCVRRIELFYQEMTNYAYLSVRDKNCHSGFLIVNIKFVLEVESFIRLFILSVHDQKTL
jgi:hypothetical protein